MHRATRSLVWLCFLTACADQASAPQPEAHGSAPASVQGPFLHVVHVGGQDICPLFDLGPGCDGNLSLVAFQHLDGSASGSWSDGPFGGNLIVDCLEVKFDTAWIGGVDRDNPQENENRWIIAVVDAGRSAKDPPDSVTRRRFAGPEGIGNPALCHGRPRGNLLATMTGVPQGQVRVE